MIRCGVVIGELGQTERLKGHEEKASTEKQRKAATILSLLDVSSHLCCRRKSFLGVLIVQVSITSSRMHRSEQHTNNAGTVRSLLRDHRTWSN
jgi:hypothetical protein